MTAFEAPDTCFISLSIYHWERWSRMMTSKSMMSQYVGEPLLWYFSHLGKNFNALSSQDAICDYVQNIENHLNKNCNRSWSRMQQSSLQFNDELSDIYTAPAIPSFFVKPLGDNGIMQTTEHCQTYSPIIFLFIGLNFENNLVFFTSSTCRSLRWYTWYLYIQRCDIYSFPSHENFAGNVLQV